MVPSMHTHEYNNIHDAPKKDAPDDDILLNGRVVRQTCGGISDMTLWRWRRDPAIGFPSPIIISGRNYWRRSEIRRWLTSRQEAAQRL